MSARAAPIATVSSSVTSRRRSATMSASLRRQSFAVADDHGLPSLVEEEARDRRARSLRGGQVAEGAPAHPIAGALAQREGKHEKFGRAGGATRCFAQRVTLADDGDLHGEAGAAAG